MRSTEFKRLLAAEVVSNFGSMLSRLAIPWLAALALAATPLDMGYLLVADVLAGTVGSLLLGAIVDRLGKRAVMLVTDVARAVVLGALAWLAALQILSFWMLVIASALSGLLTVTFELARSAWMAQHIDSAELTSGNSQLSVGSSLSEAAAFALGGWLYQWLGAALALVVDAISYLVSALCLRGVSEIKPEAVNAKRQPKFSVRSLISEARAGVTALWAVPALRAIASIELFIALGRSIGGTSYMIYVSRDLGFSTGVLGMIFALGGLGSVVGASLAPRLGRRFGMGRAMWIGLSLLAIGKMCTPLAADVSLLAIALLIASQIIGDGGHTIHDVHDRTLRQTAVSGDLVARVDGGIRTVAQVATLLGAIGGGALATLIGTRYALAVSAALVAVAAVIAWGRLVRR